MSLFSLSNFGKTRIFRYLSLCKGKCGPYIKIDFFLECPWISIKAAKGSGSRAFVTIDETRDLMAQTVGCNLMFGLINYLFRSFPLIDDR